MGVGLVALSLGSGGVEVVIAHLLHLLRAQIWHRHLGGRSRVPTAISRVTASALLRIQAILSGGYSGEQRAESHKDNDLDHTHQVPLPLWLAHIGVARL